jgi:hypothetical protein
MYQLISSPWSSIVEFYDNLVHAHGWPFQPMLELVRFIAASPYAAGLFACTSHEVLLVTRVKDPDPSEGKLQIQFDGKSQVFTFRYIQRDDKSKPWSRTCPAEEGISVLEHTLCKRLRWFTAA